MRLRNITESGDRDLVVRLLTDPQAYPVVQISELTGVPAKKIDRIKSTLKLDPELESKRWENSKRRQSERKTGVTNPHSNAVKILELLRDQTAWTDEEIASKLGVLPRYVQSLRRAAGLPADLEEKRAARRRELHPNKEQLVSRLLLDPQALTVKEIVDQTGVSEIYVKKLKAKMLKSISPELEKRRNERSIQLRLAHRQDPAFRDKMRAIRLTQLDQA